MLKDTDTSEPQDIVHPCIKCGKPVPVGDIVAREDKVRSEWRSHYAPYKSSIEIVREEHPITAACHEECETEHHVRWVQLKRCNIQGCCRPIPRGLHQRSK